MDHDETTYGRRRRRSPSWLLVAFMAFATIGALAGGLLLNAVGESATAAAFLSPAIAGVLVISRAFHEGRFAERGSRSEPPGADPPLRAREG